MIVTGEIMKNTAKLIVDGKEYEFVIRYALDADKRKNY